MASIECNTTLSTEHFLRPDGSEVSAVNSSVDGSNIPEEEPSPPEDNPEGGAVLAGGAELSEVESLVLVAVVGVSVVFVCVEEVSVEPVSVEVSVELVSVEVELVSMEVSPEPVSVELPAGLVAVAVSVELVVLELFKELVLSEDVELVRLCNY